MTPETPPADDDQGICPDTDPDELLAKALLILGYEAKGHR